MNELRFLEAWESGAEIMRTASVRGAYQKLSSLAWSVVCGLWSEVLRYGVVRYSILDLIQVDVVWLDWWISGSSSLVDDGNSGGNV